MVFFSLCHALSTSKVEQGHMAEGVKLARPVSRQSVYADDTLLLANKIINFLHIIASHCF